MISVLIAEHRPEHWKGLRAALSADPETEEVGMARDGAEALRLAHSLRPDIVVLGAGLPPGGGFAVAEALSASGLSLDCVLLTAECTPDDLRRAMRAGAKECLRESVSGEELCAALSAVVADSQRQRRGAAGGAGAKTSGRVIAVSSAKGGVGKTTLAVNLAAALAVDTGEPAVLLDLYTQFGDAALLLNLHPRRTLADLVQTDHADLDLPLLEDHLDRHPCGLQLLAGASAPLPPGALSPEGVSKLLSLLRQAGRRVVLDLPPTLDAATRRALEAADTVLLVANLFDLTTLADTRCWLDAMNLDTVQVVLNRVSPSNRLQVPDITRTLGRPVSCSVPNDGKLVPASVNAGVPFVLSHPNAKVSCSVYSLARGQL